MKTCDKCQHYTPTEMPQDEAYAFAGSCALMGDSNDQSPRVVADRAAGWDYEGYSAGVYVGPKFGCIHWAKRAQSPTQPADAITKDTP